MSSSVTSRLVSVIGTLVLTHFLAPEVVGEVAVAAALVMTARRLSTFGFGQYVVATPDLAPGGVFQIWAINFVLDVLAFIVVLVVATPLGPVFDAPGMAAYVPGLVLAGFIDRFGFIPERVLAREMRFKPIGIARGSSEIAFTVTAVSLAALADWGGYAIVAGNVVRGVIMTTIFLWAAPRKSWLAPAPYDRELTRDVLRFGAPLWVSTNANFASRTWDNLLFSSMFGPSRMGQYNLAYNLASIPTTQIGEHIGDVLVPSFTRMDDAAKQRALVRAAGLMALIIFPLAVGLGAISDTLVAALFNEEWQRVAPYLVLLSVLSVVRPISWVINSYLQSRRLTRALMYLGVFKLAVLIGAMWTLGQFGDLWACVGVGVAFGAETIASMWLIQRLDKISMWRMTSAMIAPLLACVPLYAAVLGVRELGSWPPGLGVVIETSAGAAVYVASILVVGRTVTRDFFEIVNKTFRRSR